MMGLRGRKQGAPPALLRSFPDDTKGRSGEEGAFDAALTERLVRTLALPHNTVCADCSAPDPKWVGLSAGRAVVICIRCSGIHRSLGTHISRVRSLELDNWDSAHVTKLEQGGNAKANAELEAVIPPGRHKPTADSPIEEVKEWIEDKYRNRAFFRPSTDGEGESKQADSRPPQPTKGGFSYAPLQAGPQYRPRPAHLAGTHPSEPPPLPPKPKHHPLAGPISPRGGASPTTSTTSKQMNSVGTMRSASVTPNASPSTQSAPTTPWPPVPNRRPLTMCSSPTLSLSEKLVSTSDERSVTNPTLSSRKPPPPPRPDPSTKPTLRRRAGTSPESVRHTIFTINDRSIDRVATSSSSSPSQSQPIPVSPRSPAPKPPPPVSLSDLAAAAAARPMPPVRPPRIKEPVDSGSVPQPAVSLSPKKSPSDFKSPEEELEYLRQRVSELEATLHLHLSSDQSSINSRPSRTRRPTSASLESLPSTLSASADDLHKAKAKDEENEKRTRSRSVGRTEGLRVSLRQAGRKTLAAAGLRKKTEGKSS